MNRFNELLASLDARPATVVHAGSGSYREYNAYKGLKAERVVFLEPDLRLVEEARNRLSSFTDATIIPKAIATTGGRGPLHIVSNPRFSSLLPPAELFEFYPNVTITDEVEVETVSLATLCRDLDIDETRDNLLVAEIQGLEKDVFPSTARDILHTFRWILIRSSEHELYESASGNSQKDIERAMRDAGYTVLVLNEHTPPHTNILCIRNDAAIANTLLNDRESELQKSIISLEQALNRAESERREKDVLASENTKLKADITKLANEVSEKSKELREMQQTLQIKTKLMFKANEDLSDLQDQYRTVVQQKDQQHTLLCDLKDKLTYASELYRKLNLRNLVLDGEMLVQSDPGADGYQGDDDQDNEG